jgi:hypothetical protein
MYAGVDRFTQVWRLSRDDCCLHVCLLHVHQSCLCAEEMVALYMCMDDVPGTEVPWRLQGVATQPHCCRVLVLAVQGETRPALPTSHRLPLLAFTAKEVGSAAAALLAAAAAATMPFTTIVLLLQPTGTV